MQWGTHACHLYESREDLVDVLVPFFATGLANGEKCLWVTSEPLDAAAATAALAAQVPDAGRYVASGQLEVIDYERWYKGRDADAVLQAWVDAENRALADGYAGLRLTGNVTFITSRDEWRAFQRYEQRVNELFATRRIIALCSYHLGSTGSADVLDVVGSHRFALARRDGVWDTVESAALRMAKRELHSINQVLESRVAARTAELEAQKRELEEALRMRDETQRRLEAELTDARLLGEISAALTDEEVVDGLYHKLVDAAALIMRSDFASMQRYDREHDALELLAHKGFTPEAQAFWRWVPAGRTTSCGMALQAGRRMIIDDFETCADVAGSADLAAFRAGGVRAAQSTPLLSRGGELVGMISTHWKHAHVPAERDLRLLDILARQAADLIERNTSAEALRAQTRRLLEADRRKDEFLATLAHELRNPLAPIKTGLKLLQTGDPDAAPRVLEIMDRQLRQMVRLVDDLMDVSRITRGIVVLRRERVALGAVVDQAVEASRPLIAAAGHTLDVRLPPDELWLDADATRAAQILGNLLNNAAKYTPPGGRIELSAQTAGAAVQLRVTDNGIGIPADMRGRIFDLFVQADHSIERSHGGLGVGLSLARQLAELHGGTLAVDSAGSGQGATFTVLLPRATGEADPQPVGDDNAVPTAARDLRILVIDDNEDAAETVGMLLGAMGHRVRVECDALKSLDVGGTFRPHLVLLDLGMPKISGFDLARRFRADPALRRATLVALSGWGSDEHRERSRAAGIDHHLTKPVAIAQLQPILDALARSVAGAPAA